MRHIGRDHRDDTLELRRYALIEGGEPQLGALADKDLVDVLRSDFASIAKASWSGMIIMIGSPAPITPPMVCTVD